MDVCLILLVLVSVFDYCTSRAMNVAVMVGDSENEHLIGVMKRVRRESSSEKPAEMSRFPYWGIAVIILSIGLFVMAVLAIIFYVLHRKMASLQALASVRRGEKSEKSAKALLKDEASTITKPKPEEPAPRQPSEREEASKSKKSEPADGVKKQDATPKIPIGAPPMVKKGAAPGPSKKKATGPDTPKKGAGVSADMESSTKDSSSRSGAGTYKKQLPKAPLVKQQSLPPGSSVKKQPSGPAPPMKTALPPASPRTKFLLKELTGALTTAAKAKMPVMKKK